MGSELVEDPRVTSPTQGIDKCWSDLKDVANFLLNMFNMLGS